MGDINEIDNREIEVASHNELSAVIEKTYEFGLGLTKNDVLDDGETTHFTEV